jgi:2EXR family
MDFLDLPDLGEPRENYKVYHIPGLSSNFITPVAAHDVPPDHRYYKHRLLPPSSKHQLSTTSRSNIEPQTSAFPLFPILPTEIRLKIWQLALPGPRVVRVHAYDEANYLSLFRSPTPPPQILFVCRESREQALLLYELCFGLEHINAPSTIYFNHELDTLYFEHEVRNGHGCEIVDFGVERNCLPSVTRKGLSNVERVAISHRVGQDPILYWFEYLEKFEGLEEFIIVAERGNPPVPDDAQLVDADRDDEDLKEWQDWSEGLGKNWELLVGKRFCTTGEEYFPNIKLMEVVSGSSAG